VLRFRERGGTLVLRTADVPVVRFDPEALETIVENLIENALKYAQGTPRLEISLDGTSDRVRVMAKDEGIGFAPTDGPRLFDKFFRSAGGEVQVAKGSGLGLYIARALARGAGGELSASSEGPGKGATFTLELPVAGK
jgi:signal transduction histidine kinase